MLEYFKSLSVKYNVSLENVISIALNRYGIIVNDFSDNRIRFNLEILNSNSKSFFAVCVNTYPNSPFSLKGNVLYLDNVPIGEVSGIEKDTCTSTYFRNDKKVITFNSNSRSKCVGCKFCGTYSLSDEDSIDFSTKENIISYFDKLLVDNKIRSMRDIENVTLCTGCFNSEDDLINHLLLVNESFKEMSFNGSINYIGSQLRDFDKIKEVSESIENFGMYLTIEKFTNRDKFMRPEKASLSMEQARDLLAYCSSIGVTSTFLYILGLEDTNTIQEYFEYFKDSVNKFPIVQVFQDYTQFQENYRCEEAKDIEYYLKSKQIINKAFEGKDFNPKIWECFRSLYHEDEFKKMELKKCSTRI